MSDFYISDSELRNFGSFSSFSEKANVLLKQQKIHWKLLNDNFKQLNNVSIKSFDIEGFEIRAQFNPARIISSSAKVDKETIEKRPCFLCCENLPEVQRGFNINSNYSVLCNPYPIFKEHLTIPHIHHKPQRIIESIKDLLIISRELKDNYFLFYNGPKCGASAPDHLHFQAAQKNSTPLEAYYYNLLNSGEVIFDKTSTKIYLIDKSVYNFVTIKSNIINEIIDCFSIIYNQLKSQTVLEEEPMLNIISFYDNGEWNLIIVPRKKHRPKQYYDEGEKQLLISPASVDMMGLLIIPRQKDFERLNNEIVEDIYSQVLLAELNLKI